MQPTQVLMRNSERSTFRRCRLKWDWSYNRRLDTDRPKGALSFGSLVHEALAEYYPPGRKRGPRPADTFQRLYEANPQRFDQWDEEGNRHAALDLGVTMLEGYAKEYGPEDWLEIVQPEIPLEVDVFDKHGSYVCTWVGRGDAMYRDLTKSKRDRPHLGFLEHKTAKSIEDDVPIVSGYGEQGLSYWWGGTVVARHRGWLAEDAHVDEILFNWLRKAVPSMKPRNEDGYTLNRPSKESLVDACIERSIAIPKKATLSVLGDLLLAAGVDPTQFGEISKVQPRPLFHRQALDIGQVDRAEINRRIRLDAGEMMRVRAKQLPVYKNPTKDCKWDCQFRDACEVHEMGGDWESILEMEFREWNPYDGHELLEEKAR